MEQEYNTLKKLTKDPYWREQLRKKWYAEHTYRRGEGQDQQTPDWVCREMLGCVSLQGKRILVLNVEFLEEITDPTTEIYFWADTERKEIYVHTFYPRVQILTGNFLNTDITTMKKFDVVAMNPPYQTDNNKSGRTTHASALYDKFIEKVINELQPEILVSVNPSRWMTGGRGLDTFRQRMMSDHRIRKIVHFPGVREIFTEVSITGGVNYWIWDKNYNGPCEFNVGNTTSTRYLDAYDIIPQDNLSLSILAKIQKQTTQWMNKSWAIQTPFGLHSSYQDWEKTGIPCYARGNEVYNVSPNAYTDKHNIQNKWKVATSKATSEGNITPDKTGAMAIATNFFLIEPGAICTQTYIIVNIFDTRKEAENFIKYMQTKFFRFMLGLRCITQDINKEKFAWVPDLTDYKTPPTDTQLYEHYKLTRQEIAYIENKIKPIQIQTKTTKTKTTKKAKRNPK